MINKKACKMQQSSGGAGKQNLSDSGWTVEDKVRRQPSISSCRLDGVPDCIEHGTAEQKWRLSNTLKYHQQPNSMQLLLYQGVLK